MIGDANADAPEFMEDFDARFAKESLSDHDAHGPVLDDEDRELVLSQRCERTMDGVASARRGSGRAPAFEYTGALQVVSGLRGPGGVRSGGRSTGFSSRRDPMPCFRSGLLLAAIAASTCASAKPQPATEGSLRMEAGGAEATGIPEAAARMDIPLDGWDRPVLIAQGTEDRRVPSRTVVRFARDLCGAGATVQLNIYDGEDHSGPMKVGLDDFTAWVAARFADDPAPDGRSNLRAAGELP